LTRRVRRATLTAAAGLVAVALTIVPAAAASAGGSNWWFDWYDTSAAHSAGWTGDGVKVAVIDSQINPQLPVFQGTGLTVHEPAVCGGSSATTTPDDGSAHGSDVTALLIGNGTGPGSVAGIAPKAKVTFYGLGQNPDPDSATTISCSKTIDGLGYSEMGLAIRQAVADGNRIISISVVGADSPDGDIAAIAQAVARGVVIVAGSGNHIAQVDQDFPEGANGVVGVNAFGDDGALQKDDGSVQASDAGKTVAWNDTTVVAAGVGFPTQAASKPSWSWGESAESVRGSSLATPLVAGMLADTLQKYPKATGNRLIQSLIRNTTADDHALRFEEGTGFGYGPASLSHLLREDPAQYPDTNPLLDKAHGLGMPTAADITAAAGGAAAGGGAAGGDPATPPVGSAVGSIVTTGLVIGGIVLAVIIVGVILLVVLLTRRGRRARRGTA
jgi:hypothetical protein